MMTLGSNLPLCTQKTIFRYKNLKQTIIFSHHLQNSGKLVIMMIIFLYCDQGHLFEFIWTSKLVLSILLNHCQELADIATESLVCTSKFFKLIVRKVCTGWATGGRVRLPLGRCNQSQIRETPVSSALLCQPRALNNPFNNWSAVL